MYYALKCKEYQSLFLDKQAFEKVAKQYPHALCKTFPTSKEGLSWLHEKTNDMPSTKKQTKQKTSLNYQALSSQQKETIEGACNLFHKGKRVITIYGAAGTGKTTIVKFIMKKLKISNKQLLFTTFTGRASLMLRKKVLMPKRFILLFIPVLKIKMVNFIFV